MLDWKVFVVRQWMHERTVHHAVGELEKIRRTMQALAQADRVQKVATYDGPQLDRDRAERHATARQARQNLLAQLDLSDGAPTPCANEAP
ncbi:hypothetical protein GB931_04545 [Modestobacter sp. I12A-02628]|uniref:Uncharacterized protein n=1 Tax=Goekera deserti TaxID=2497753 RepID=A0A7K3WDN2_9ACTN|nr:hypothetical protein [Goekera deserti]MPQ97207.1 hypothetical protein [Goekera deserti]NDI46475.1 hypothetical protein [Goekera deserti]NEL54591.1 hypothetical protein [Goekera deserti]